MWAHPSPVFLLNGKLSVRVQDSCPAMIGSEGTAAIRQNSTLVALNMAEKFGPALHVECRQDRVEGIHAETDHDPGVYNLDLPLEVSLGAIAEPLGFNVTLKAALLETKDSVGEEHDILSPSALWRANFDSELKEQRHKRVARSIVSRLNSQVVSEAICVAPVLPNHHHFGVEVSLLSRPRADLV